MKNDFNYKWSKIFASKRFKREDGFITLAPIEQHELLKDAESLVKKLTLTDVGQQRELLKAFDDWCLNNEGELSSSQDVYIDKFFNSL